MSRRSHTQGFSLYRQPYAENDLIVTFFTQSHGLISGFAAGARKSQKRFPHQFSPWAFYDMSLSRRGGDLFTVLRCDVKKPFFQMSSNIEKIALLNYVLEIVKGSAPREEQAPALFNLLVDLYLYLENHEFATESEPGRVLDFPADVLTIFELRLLRILGFEPGINRCAQCHGRIDPNQEGASILFSPAAGGAIHERCALSDGVRASSIRVSAQTLWSLSQALLITDERWRQYCMMRAQKLDLQFTRQARRESRAVLPTFLEYQLGHSVRSRAMVNELIGTA